MRFESRFTAAMALLIPLAGASCSSKQYTWVEQPAPTALTDLQAATLARAYLEQNSVPTTGLITAEERLPNGWWLYYQTPFDAAARPPSVCYLIQVHDDGTVDHLR